MSKVKYPIKKIKSGIGGTRTHALLIKSQLLFHLSYNPNKIIQLKWRYSSQLLQIFIPKVGFFSQIGQISSSLLFSVSLFKIPKIVSNKQIILSSFSSIFHPKHKKFFCWLVLNRLVITNLFTHSLTFWPDYLFRAN